MNIIGTYKCLEKDFFRPLLPIDVMSEIKSFLSLYNFAG